LRAAIGTSILLPIPLDVLSRLRDVCWAHTQTKSGKIDDVYPLLACVELYLWPQRPPSSKSIPTSGIGGRGTPGTGAIIATVTGGAGSPGLQCPDWPLVFSPDVTPASVAPAIPGILGGGWPLFA
jgi:hypothetical protein